MATKSRQRNEPGAAEGNQRVAPASRDRFLLHLVRNGSEHEALAALQALELHRDSHEITRKIEEMVEKRGESVVETAFRLGFLAR